MNKFVTSTLALTAAGTVASAMPGDSEWTGLDSQLESIRSSYTADSHDLLASVGGLVSSSLTSADLETSFNTGGADTLGFNLDNAILWAEGQVGDRFSWRIAINGTNSFGGGAIAITEAFGDWNFDNGTLRMGDFRPTLNRHQGYDREEQLFINSPLSAVPVGDPQGVQYMGSAGSIDYAVGVTNGNDGTGDEIDLHGRVQWNMNEGVGGNEGAYGASDGLVGTIGLFVLAQGDDIGGAGGPGGTLFGVDVQFTGDRWSAGGAFITSDDDVTGVANLEPSPIMVQGSYMVSEDGEVALRYEDADLNVDTSRITVGYNWYQQGTNAFWQVNAGTDETGNNTDGTFIQIAWVLGESGHRADPGSGQR